MSWRGVSTNRLQSRNWGVVQEQGSKSLGTQSQLGAELVFSNLTRDFREPLTLEPPNDLKDRSDDYGTTMESVRRAVLHRAVQPIADHHSLSLVAQAVIHPY